jgi:hypothetical protein
MRSLKPIEWGLIVLAVIGLIALLTIWELSSSYNEGDAAFNRGDFETAVKEWRPLAEAGDPDYQNRLAQMYETGKGTTLNAVEAVKWYRQSAEQGFVPGQHNLARMLQRGEGVAKNYKEAAKLYRQAAEQGYAPAQNGLGAMLHAGLGLAVNPVEALMWFEIAATGKHKAATANRDRAAKSMSAADIEEAKRRARRWLDQHGD